MTDNSSLLNNRPPSPVPTYAEVPGRKYLDQMAACAKEDAQIAVQRTVLNEASVVVKERGENYGPPSKNHERTAAMWSVLFGVEVTPRQVCLANILQKISRDVQTPLRDNLIDIAGYASNAGEV